MTESHPGCLGNQCYPVVNSVRYAHLYLRLATVRYTLRLKQQSSIEGVIQYSTTRWKHCNIKLTVGFV